MAKIALPAFPWEKIAAIPRSHRIGICVATFLLLGGGFFYFIHMPKTASIGRLKRSYGDLQTRVAKAKKDAENLEKYRKEYKEAEGKFKLALQLLPDKREIPSLLEGISRSGRQSGLEFLLFKPGKEIAKEFYAEIPVKIEVTGGYHNLAVFFAKVAQLPRIVNISDLSIKAVASTQQGQGALQASCSATTYQFIEPKQAEPEQGKGQKGKKR
jgi:type IV pilus assembly protein PilO